MQYTVVSSDIRGGGGGPLFKCHVVLSMHNGCRFEILLIGNIIRMTYWAISDILAILA